MLYNIVVCGLFWLELVNLLGREGRSRETAANLWHLISWLKTAERMAEDTTGGCQTWSPKNWQG